MLRLRWTTSCIYLASCSFFVKATWIYIRWSHKSCTFWSSSTQNQESNDSCKLHWRLWSDETLLDVFWAFAAPFIASSSKWPRHLPQFSCGFHFAKIPLQVWVGRDNGHFHNIIIDSVRHSYLLWKGRFEYGQGNGHFPNVTADSITPQLPSVERQMAVRSKQWLLLSSHCGFHCSWLPYQGLSWDWDRGYVLPKSHCGLHHGSH